MNILIVGSGGREHALARSLARSPLCGRVYVLPGNPGMAEATCLPGDPMDIPATVRTAREYGVDFCVVTPEDPLAAGLSDALRAAGIACFGPSAAAARIESSKVFSKGLMKRYGIPTAAFEVFDELEPARRYVRDRAFPLVIKADGLAKGKGVIIARDLAEAQAALEEMLSGRAFGQSGARVVVEEYLEGPEVSVLCLSDGRSIRPLVSAMDHKRALDGDLGPNTGGMGAIAPNPFYTDAMAGEVMDTILMPTIAAMRQEGCPFSGCLFVGLMLTGNGPRVLEYNARFGDPETQAVLPLIASDLLPHLLACERGGLDREPIRFHSAHACCLVMVSKGYPGRFETGFPVRVGLVASAVCYAGVRAAREGLATAGGRVLSLTALGGDLRQAVDAVYRDAKQVQCDNLYYRGDIGRKALEGRQM